ncbi:MAG: HNH endonuclease [Leptolyngbya sp. UWPOB_LEPTO1]|uniref:HNH endonuclease signature motif containing protein n=1 Tax=Leptolyngbya sp. UWPOB_LEPTO1 TaxID=2815653 RepID=UPI001AC367A8|nr:HNH endonuclease signature motif containing protein [Leptolyngbya sp. UWPOB_LEPTO1]MBN8564722.1 HNH endonuclease [Leptolyngbya sp. UWPOB_LEPTO1]
MGKGTFKALMRRGFDSETANRLASNGYSLNSLKNLDKNRLQELEISEELIQALLQEPRPPIPLEILNKVLYESRMTCCVCRDRSQGIIVHHIHEFSDSRSHAEENLIVLCLNHHGEAHTKRELQLNLTPDRLREFKARWLNDVKQYDTCEALSINSDYSYEAIKRISEFVHHSISFYSSSNTPKFSLKAEEMSDGRISRRLTKENSNETIWELIQFPRDGYPTQTIAADDQLIISDFGSSCLQFYKLQDRKFNHINLDNYEAGNLALLSEKKKFGKAPVIRRYPPGDMILVDNKLFVGQIFSEFVLVIDLNSKEVIKRIPVGGEGNFSYCSVNKLLYFASNNLGVFFIINPINYQFKAVSYPEPSLHIGNTFCHPDSGLFYITLHRTSVRDLARTNDEEVDEANCFIVIYNPSENKYISHVSLTIDEEDKLERCWASSIAYDRHNKTLYIGMLGSPKNIYIFDTVTNKILSFIKTRPNTKNKNDHVDSLSLALYQDYLISVNRSNYELEIIERHTLQHLLSVPLGGVGNGPRHICICNNQAYISHSEYAGVIHADLNKLLELIPRQGFKID